MFNEKRACEQMKITTTSCKGCGRELSAAEIECPVCNSSLHVAPDISSIEGWEQELKRVRFHWIVVVIIFWVTAVITAGLFLINGSAYLSELIVIAAVFMVLGVYLKTKVLKIQHNKPTS